MRSILVVLLSLWSGSVLAATNSWSLASPNGRCVISVSLGDDGTPSYQVHLGGKLVILRSPLGVRRDEEAFDRGLALYDPGKAESRKEAYDLFVGVAPRIEHTLNYRSILFRTATNARLIIDLTASDEGVSFRYRFADSMPGVRVLQAELTGFRVAQNARGWLQPYHAAGPYTPAYEDFYFNVSPGDPPPQSRAKPIGWCFPALFHVPEAAAWVLLTESGTDGSYCGCHLAADSSGGLYRIAFPAADEATKGQTNRVGPEPRSALPWTMPWRVVVLGNSAGDISTATLVTDLAPPSRLSDTSWICPGRASWAWWSHPDGPATAALIDEFTDFGARMKWEYTLFDAGWWTPGLKPIARHAQAKGVAPLAWLSAGDFYDSAKRKRKLDEVQASGVRGVKVDFWCSDRQEAIGAMHDLFDAAAARRMVVNLHGCTLPRGWQRTWPNFLTAEAVLGTESYFYEPRYTEKAAELNTVLPFTRNAVGPMDSTPVACSPKKYPRTTTAAHELATALIFTSGIIHYADQPEFFDSLPAQATQVLQDAPARWDETRCLVGEPGRVAVFARRAARTWFIAGINGTTNALPVALDLAPFSRFRHRLLIAEGGDPIMQVTALPAPLDDRWEHRMPSRGGFIFRLDSK
jgi:alpha-glucosidase